MALLHPMHLALVALAVLLVFGPRKLPELAKDSPFKLLGGKVVYTQHAPGAELLYQVRQHKISVFIFQSRDVHGGPSAGNKTFVVNDWHQGGLQFYVVTDAAREDADRLRALLEEANRS